MKRISRLLSCVCAFAMLFSIVSFAKGSEWGNIPGNNKQSILLQNGELQARDAYTGLARGEILSMAMSEITNKRDGTLHVSLSTYTHRAVDKIYQEVFLEQWDEDKEAWVQIGNWEFERTKEEEELGDLVSHTVGFTVTGCEVNKYYRVRGLHLARLGEVQETFATQTNGVLLTKIF